MQTSTSFHPIFPSVPNDEYLARWRECIARTGRPEDFEGVSTNKPTQLENIVLLSEEIKVPVGLRPGGDKVPCPFCATTAPKFIRGRMAYFPDEQAVRFVGHRCAQTHFGDNFKHAERTFRRQMACRSYIDLWKEVAEQRSGLVQFVEPLSAIAEDLHFTIEQLDGHARGFRTFLHTELAQTDGELFLRSDLGMTDRLGNAVVQSKSIGKAAGLRFLWEGYSAARDLRQMKSALADSEHPLPEWHATSPEHPATDEIIRRGRMLEKALRNMLPALADIQDGIGFFAPKNVGLIHRWGNRPQTPFAKFEFGLAGRQLLVRCRSIAGEYFANVLIPDGVQKGAVPAAPVSELLKKVA